MQYELDKSSATGEWSWRLKGNNGETVVSGKNYKNKVDAERDIHLLKNSKAASLVELHDGKSLIRLEELKKVDPPITSSPSTGKKPFQGFR